MSNPKAANPSVAWLRALVKWADARVNAERKGQQPHRVSYWRRQQAKWKEIAEREQKLLQTRNPEAYDAAINRMREAK